MLKWWLIDGFNAVYTQNVAIFGLVSLTPKQVLALWKMQHSVF